MKNPGSTDTTTINGPSDLIYEDMFVPIELGYLRALHQQNRRAIDEIAENYLGWTHGNAKLHMSRAVAISVFCTNIMNKTADEHPKDAQMLSNWTKKYGDLLIENLNNFPELFDTEKWKVIAYVCPSTLEKLKPARDFIHEIAQYDFVELRTMKYPSIGHSPGALWRLLSISDYSLDELLVFDIDEPWNNSNNQWHNETIKYNKALTRGVHIPRNNFWLGLDKPWGNPDARTNSYPPILCSKIHIIPEQLGIADIDKLIAAYVFLRMRQSRSSNPVSQMDIREPVTAYNRPLSDEEFGHKNHWYQYCFDERFLKHVIFPHAVNCGEVCTYCLPQNVTPDLVEHFSRPSLAEFRADFRYTQRINSKNIIINQNKISNEHF